MTDTERVRAFSTDVQLVQLAAPQRLGPLQAAILAERDRHPGLTVSQVNGWHSLPDLAQRSDGLFRPLMKSIVQTVGEQFERLAADRGLNLPRYGWAVQAWASVLDPGGYNRVHDHASSHWSVAFYVDAGDPASELGGVLSFLDPRRSSLNIPGVLVDPVTMDVTPRTGMLVIFPGYLQHMVHPYDGTRPRVVVSANLSVRSAPAGA